MVSCLRGRARSQFLRGLLHGDASRRFVQPLKQRVREIRVFGRGDVCVVDEFVLAYRGKYTPFLHFSQDICLPVGKKIFLANFFIHRFGAFIHSLTDELCVCGYLSWCGLLIPQSFSSCGKLCPSLYWNQLLVRGFRGEFFKHRYLEACIR